MTVGLVLVGGHESDSGSDLARLAPVLPGAATTGVGRGLVTAARAALDAHGTVVVVPMTFGRDPALIAEAAKTLRWLATAHPGRIALAEPFGTADHLVSRLRAAAADAARRDPDAALVVHARSSDPFDDAELHRVAHLVRVHGAGLEVAVATTTCDQDLAPVIARLRLLGFPRAVVVPAGFAAGRDVAALNGVTHHGPLLTDVAISRVVAERADEALHRLDHGHDGIAAGLGADHDHGFAHSHGPGEHDHDHPHSRRDPAWRPARPATTTEAPTSRSTPAATP